MSDTTRIAYGQSVSSGRTADRRALSQCSVTDLATTRATQERHFAHRERREVVVQHEALLGFAFERFQPLLVFAGAQRGGNQRLGLAAGKYRRSVRARQHADFDPDIANLVELAAIRTPLLFDHLLAEDLLAQHVEVLARLLAASFVFFRNAFLHFRLQLLDHRVAVVLRILLGVDRVGQLRAKLRAQFAEVRFVGNHRLDHALRLAHLLRQLVDGGANLLDLGVTELDGVDDRLFRNFLRARLDHHDAVHGADDHQVQLARALLVVGRVDDELAIRLPDAHRANGTVERNVRDAQRHRRAVDAGNIRIVRRVRRKHHGDDLGLAAEAFREQRTDRTVDLAAGQNFALARTPFALDESARDASGGVGVLAVVNREREKVDALAGVGVGAGGGENHVFANANDAGAVRLLGQLAGFKVNGLTAVQLNCYFMLRFHLSSFRWKTQPMRSPRPLRSLESQVLVLAQGQCSRCPDGCGSGMGRMEFMSAERG